DGFSMFATKATRYNVVNWTPFARDPLKELADECRREGVKLFFYYSQLDWHHPDYWPLGRTGHASGRPDAGDWNGYLAFMEAQLTELLTNYGPVGGVWLRTYGTSIYATRGGPIPPQPWGVTTQRRDSVFVHVLDWPDRVLSIPAFGARIVWASVLGSGERAQVVQTENSVTLTLPLA